MANRTLRETHERIDRLHAEFERRKQGGLPPPKWEELEAIASSANDIVHRLRAVAEFGGTHLDGLWTEAANEIEALRSKIEILEAELLVTDGLLKKPR